MDGRQIASARVTYPKYCRTRWCGWNGSWEQVLHNEDARCIRIRVPRHDSIFIGWGAAKMVRTPICQKSLADAEPDMSDFCVCKEDECIQLHFDDMS